MFAQDTLPAGVTNILMQCRLYNVQRGLFLFKWVGGCAGITGIRISPPSASNKVCFSTLKLYEKPLFPFLSFFE